MSHAEHNTLICHMLCIFFLVKECRNTRFQYGSYPVNQKINLTYLLNPLWLGLAQPNEPPMSARIDARLVSSNISWIARLKKKMKVFNCNMIFITSWGIKPIFLKDNNQHSFYLGQPIRFCSYFELGQG